LLLLEHHVPLCVLVTVYVPVPTAVVKLVVIVLPLALVVVVVITELVTLVEVDILTFKLPDILTAVDSTGGGKKLVGKSGISGGN
jgi:hypothetical protein